MTDTDELTELKERNQLLDEVLGSVPVLIIRADVHGHVTHAEGDGLRRWGLEAQALVALDLLEKYGPDTEVGAGVRKALAGDRASGTAHYANDTAVEYHIVPRRDERGVVVGLNGLVLDVSDSRRRDRAERESAAKSKFLAAMSHELRTPLNSILGFNQLLGSESFGSLTDRQRRYVENIQSSGMHLLSLLNDVLDLAKVSSGAMELQIAPVSVKMLCGQVVDTMRPQAMGREVEIELDSDPTHVVMADERRLAQALLNLVANAVKFSPRGGRVRVSSYLAGDAVAIAVADNGVGIPPEKRSEIFEEFCQLAEGRAMGGTGLGLPLTRQLVLAMGGLVDLESEVGRGSTFTVRMAAA